MIIKMKKYIFIGLQSDLETFFERAQEKGLIEFLSRTKRKATDFPKHVQDLITALKILRKQPKVTPITPPTDLDPLKIASHIIEMYNWHEKLLEDRRSLQMEIDRIKPFGYFSIKELQSLEKEISRHIQFFCVKRTKAKKMAISEELIHVATEFDMDYFMSISKTILKFPGMIEMHIEKSLSDLKRELETVKQSLQSTEKELKEYAAYLPFLHEHLIHGFNAYHLDFSKSEVSTHMNDALFAIEGWIPGDRVHALFPLLEGLGIHAEEVAAEKDERIPTCMKNRGYSRIGEDLVHVYDTPATSDKDPSLWVFWAFALFFAIIVSDAGYGLIYLAIVLFLRKKFSPMKAGLRRVVRLFTIISCSCIVWGILSGSYFGLEFAPKHPLNRASLIYFLAEKKADYHLKVKDKEFWVWEEKFPSVENTSTGREFLQTGVSIENGVETYDILDEFRDSIFMEIGLLIGVIHICLSLLRYARRHWAGIGWILAIWGGYLYFPSILNTTSLVNFLQLMPKHSAYEIGLQLLLSGVGLAVALSIVQKRWVGLLEITKVIEIFADILSYLRLYALGLATMILASTFNQLGREVGFVAGFFIILLGHGVNVVVGIIGGVIHGLRLNFIEWYHHSFEGGGKIFSPLKLLKVKGE
jgi:V/A-type H+-transporting ATPase subunit I